MSTQSIARWLRDHSGTVQEITISDLTATGYVVPVAPWSIPVAASNEVALRGAILAIDADEGVGGSDAEIRLRGGAAWEGSELTIISDAASAESLDVVLLPSTVLITLAAGARCTVRATGTAWVVVAS